MKNQYVGDVNDYRKYGLLRHLSDGIRCRLGVCWMLTVDDGRSDGKKVEYLESPTRWRGYDPELFDALHRFVHRGDRRIGAIEQSGCLPRALFFSDMLTDDRGQRASYFREAERRLARADLVFFDPDNGLEVGSCAAGHKGSFKYLYWDELKNFFRSRKSVIVFQHFIREKRGMFIRRLMDAVATRLAPAAVFAFQTPNVLFLLASQPAHVDWFRDRVRFLQASWPPKEIRTLMSADESSLTDGEETCSRRDPGSDLADQPARSERPQSSRKARIRMSEDNVRPSIRPVARWDWQVLPMPLRRQIVEVDQPFTSEEFAAIQLGACPQLMEEKWFAFYEAPYLYLHRSWTGLLMYRVRFDPAASGARAVEVLVNRERRAYKSTDPGSHEAEKAFFLIRQVFFPEQHVRYPLPKEPPENDVAFLSNWSFYGSLTSYACPPGIPSNIRVEGGDRVKAYWVVPGKLLAGLYPGDPDADIAAGKIGWLAKAGIRCFLNLTQEGEVSRFGPMRSYSAALDQAKKETEKHEPLLRIEPRCLCFPIRDLGVPSVDQMRRTLDAIDQSLHNELPVYVHCLGGRGRTGTVVGCYLIRHGLADRADVLDAIRELRAAGGLDRDGDSPETTEQRKFVLDWIEHDRGFRRIPSLEDQFRGCLLGLAIGDALGTALEFKSPGTFEPITDLVGGGPFHLKPGQWTDDTSMALCLGDSLLSCDGFNPRDQLERYVRWWRTGYMSSTGDCFDIGNTIREALQAFERTGQVDAGSTDPQKAGNGSIMRLAPVPLFYFDTPGKAIERSAESSRTTHGARTTLDGCRLLAALILGALQGYSKDQLLSPDFWPVPGEMAKPGMHFEIQELVAGSYRRKNPPEIKGTGYVVRSLEAALWAFCHSTSFKEGALLAVNLGDDADTTGAVYGQLAGAYYGASCIPPEWLDKLHARKLITQFADRLLGAIF